MPKLQRAILMVFMFGSGLVPGLLVLIALTHSELVPLTDLLAVLMFLLVAVFMAALYSCYIGELRETIEPRKRSAHLPADSIPNGSWASKYRRMRATGT